ncbi:MAG: hypothetical protein E5X67_36765 [Mesorhizobium sp.]|uniref:hypothetical protein n=1 Tax=Mesorhizobium sp. TaxID=1871066 RepID=UPI0011FFA59E|nr:hypothetical protein [Mesorhizobium sp.]TIP22512.1 MAG: hypothetical protein E5X67_36765 [Mesorhizobium sp.]
MGGIDAPLENRPLSSRVEAQAGFGLSTADIACVLATDEQDLKATYAHELESGAIKANARLPKASTATRPVKVGRPSLQQFSG